jgi:arsenate reductase
MSDKTYNVLFLCTGNSARSIMAEGLVTVLGKGRFKGYSAGSRPAGAVQPLAIAQLTEIGYPVHELRSKSWDVFAEAEAPQMDFIFTVCDNAAGETCPVWPGHPISAHWGFQDPAAFIGTEAQKREFYHKVFREIRNRISMFVNLPLHMLEKNAIRQELDRIGKESA